LPINALLLTVHLGQILLCKLQWKVHHVLITHLHH